MPPLLDTNIILRYLTQDNPDQSHRAYQLMHQLDAGTLTLTLTEGVLIEVVQVLASKSLYDLPRHQVSAHLAKVITLRGVKLPTKAMYLRALDLYTSFPHLDIVDALLAAQAERAKERRIYSFDQDFDHVPGITRQEP